MAGLYLKQDAPELELFLNLLDQDMENVRRVINEVEENDIDAEFIVHSKAETVEESSENTGVDPSNIVKTLVFKSGDEFVAVLCPGNRRVDKEKLGEITGENVRMAKPGEVKDSTGYKVGGVSPFDLDIKVYMEESILEKEEVKPAAGSRVVGAEIDPGELEEASGAETVDISG